MGRVRHLVRGNNAAFLQKRRRGKETVQHFACVIPVLLQRYVQDVAAVTPRLASPARQQQRQRTQKLHAPNTVQHGVLAQLALRIQPTFRQHERRILGGENRREEFKDVHLQAGGVGEGEDLADTGLRGFAVHADHRHVVSRKCPHDLVDKALDRVAQLLVLSVRRHVHEHVVALRPQQHAHRDDTVMYVCLARIQGTVDVRPKVGAHLTLLVHREQRLHRHRVRGRRGAHVHHEAAADRPV